jgi:hypothetical protein
MMDINKRQKWVYIQILYFKIERGTGRILLCNNLRRICIYSLVSYFILYFNLISIYFFFSIIQFNFFKKYFLIEGLDMIGGYIQWVIQSWNTTSLYILNFLSYLYPV